VAVFAFVHPTRLFREAGQRLDPFRTPVVFAQQADAICADYERSASYLPQAAVNADGLAAIQRFAADFLAVAQREVAKLHALPLPAKDRALAQAWIATHDRIVVLLEQLRDAAQRKDAVAVLMVVADLDANAEKEDQLARRLGLSDCSNL
jgi:hypothetical protein